jgi:hypothetical protein
MITTKNDMTLKMFLVEEQKMSLTVKERADVGPS